MKLALFRILALSIDYVIITVYALLLFLIASRFEISPLSPWQGQLIGFVTLTLPVVSYFYYSEKGKHRATLGKRALRLSVTTGESKNSILIRNVLKFLPWEIAHAGVHWLLYFDRNELDIPVWVWILLILPQTIAFTYFLSLFLYRGKQTFFDKVSGTTVTINNTFSSIKNTER